MAVLWVDGGSDSSSCGGGALALALRGTSGSVLLLATVSTASGRETSVFAGRDRPTFWYSNTDPPTPISPMKAISEAQVAKRT